MKWIKLSFPVWVAVLTLATLAALAGVVVSAPGTVVVPNSLATTEGNTNNTIPFATKNSARYQQVFAASEFAYLSGPHQITQISFRPDASRGNAFSATIPNIQVNLSTTGAAPDGLSATFATNVGGDDTVVFSGSLSLSSANTGPKAGPKDFDIVINLETPFLYDPTVGNLLLDVRIFSGVSTTPFVFDAHDEPADPISRVGAFDSASSTSAFTDTIGLVARFTTTPATMEDDDEEDDDEDEDDDDDDDDDEDEDDDDDDDDDEDDDEDD